MVQKNLRQHAIKFTKFWVLLFVVIATRSCFFSDAMPLTLNEWGDFMAGFFAPLAFMWLVLGYFQQGEELRQNTEALKLQAEELRSSNEALRLQAEELKNSVEQQRASVGLMREKMQYDKDLAKKGIQPKFKFINQSVSNHDVLQDPVQISVDVLNEGAAVTRVVCEARGKWLARQSKIVLGHNEKLTIVFSANKDSICDDNSIPIHFDIEYVDEEQDKHQLRFVLVRANAEGKIIQVVEKIVS